MTSNSCARVCSKNIWSEDEIACFLRALPERTLADAKKECREGGGEEKAKQQITLAVILNAAGGKEVPTVIGKAASPKYFEGLKDKKNPLGVPYDLNAKVWMNSDIMFDILRKTKRKLAQQKRNVALLLENFSSHPPKLSGRTSIIIKNFKAQY